MSISQQIIAQSQPIAQVFQRAFFWQSCWDLLHELGSNPRRANQQRHHPGNDSSSRSDQRLLSGNAL